VRIAIFLSLAEILAGIEFLFFSNIREWHRVGGDLESVQDGVGF